MCRETRQTWTSRWIAVFLQALGLCMSLRCRLPHKDSCDNVVEENFNFPRRVLLVTVPGEFDETAPRKSWRSFPLVVLAQRTALVLWTVFSNKQQRLRRREFGLQVWQRALAL